MDHIVFERFPELISTQDAITNGFVRTSFWRGVRANRA